MKGPGARRRTWKRAAGEPFASGCFQVSNGQYSDDENEVIYTGETLRVVAVDNRADGTRDARGSASPADSAT